MSPQLIVSLQLKVLHIISGDRWAGAEAQAYTLLRALKQNVELHVILMNDGELARKLISENIPTTIIDENRYGSRAILKEIARVLKNIRPDVIHTHRQKENILGNIANFITIRAKSIRTVHGAPEYTPTGMGKLQVWLDDFSGKYLQQGMIAVSEKLKSDLSATFPPHKIHVIPNGIDIESIRTQTSDPDFKRQSPNARHIGLIGRLDPVKRVDIFLEMARILLSDRPEDDWRFHVFGEGKLDSTLKTQAAALNILDHLDFHGHRMDIRDCIHGLDLIVMPSDHEGLPMVVLESLALETPVLAHAVGELVNILDDPLLCREHQAAAYAKKVLHVLDAKHPAPPLQEVYTAKVNADAVLSLYRSLTPTR